MRRVAYYLVGIVMFVSLIVPFILAVPGLLLFLLQEHLDGDAFIDENEARRELWAEQDI